MADQAVDGYRIEHGLPAAVVARRPRLRRFISSAQLVERLVADVTAAAG